MKTTKHIAIFMTLMGLLLLAFNLSAAPHEVVLAFSGLPVPDGHLFAGMAMAGTVANDEVMRTLDAIESNLSEFQTKAKMEIANTSKMSVETKNALDAIGLKQKELADEILLIKQKAVARGQGASQVTSQGWGRQIVNNANFSEVIGGNRNKAKFNITNNTVTGSNTTVGADRRVGVVPGAFAPLRVEDLFKHIPTSSNMIEYTRENVFTNSAAETSESSDAAESSITFTLVQQPISNVVHWLKVSKQLASDNVALAEYINARLMYGVNRRVDTQLIQGNGVAPNMNGLLTTGNYTVHGYTAAQVGTPLAKHRLIRRVISDMRAAGFVPNAILLNPSDWLAFDLDLISSSPASLSASDIAKGFLPMLFGVPVIESNAIQADTFLVTDTVAAGSIYDRQDVEITLSDSDDDNFTKGLITVKAERRLALAVEQVAASRGGDLTPA